MSDSGHVVVDGATGYVGSHLIHELAGRKQRIRALVRGQAARKDVEFLRDQNADVYELELSRDQQLLEEALAGAACAVHLIGSIAPRKNESFDGLHLGQTRSLVDACKRAGVKRIVMVTALGTGADAASAYHRSKWQAEEYVRQSGLDFTILRPSLIVGRIAGHRDSKLVARYRGLISTRPRVPLLGGGFNRLQPVFVGDLARALAAAATGSDSERRTLEIGGAEVVTMRELVTRLARVLGISKPFITVPSSLAYLGASVLELVSSVPLLSRDQVKLSGIDNVCVENALTTVLGVEPTDLDLALATYAAEPRAVSRV